MANSTRYYKNIHSNDPYKVFDTNNADANNEKFKTLRIFSPSLYDCYYYIVYIINNKL